ncbi:hypothetical protein K470DRAFT_285329 [Piedraia hortae CBS 480.64]|uniref:Uncharacterized protein n=1 Tax=Piedraia hortae CBS 480.64 TaxID=1314780 RepID=A0A6A7C3S5_9PEZI|nr:hypothetical protein K470DRAFT_285329 [Piedraia hortae CBS 480.64]
MARMLIGAPGTSRPAATPVGFADQATISEYDDDVNDMINSGLYTRGWTLIGTESPPNNGDEWFDMKFMQLQADNGYDIAKAKRPLRLRVTEDVTSELIPLSLDVLGKYYDYLTECIDPYVRGVMLVCTCQPAVKSPVFDVPNCVLVRPKTNRYDHTFFTTVDTEAYTAVLFVPIIVTDALMDSLHSIGVRVMPTYQDTWSYSSVRISLSRHLRGWRRDATAAVFAERLNCDAVATATFTVSVVLEPLQSARGKHTSRCSGNSACAFNCTTSLKRIADTVDNCTHVNIRNDQFAAIDALVDGITVPYVNTADMYSLSPKVFNSCKKEHLSVLATMMLLMSSYRGITNVIIFIEYSNYAVDIVESIDNIRDSMTGITCVVVPIGDDGKEYLVRVSSINGPFTVNRGSIRCMELAVSLQYKRTNMWVNGTGVIYGVPTLIGSEGTRLAPLMYQRPRTDNLVAVNFGPPRIGTSIDIDTVSMSINTLVSEIMNAISKYKKCYFCSVMHVVHRRVCVNCHDVNDTINVECGEQLSAKNTMCDERVVKLCYERCYAYLDEIGVTRNTTHHITGPLCRYILGIPRSMPIRHIILGERPYGNRILPYVASAMSYDPLLTNVTPSVHYIARDIHNHTDMDYNTARDWFQESWKYLRQGVLVMNICAYTPFIDPLSDRERVATEQFLVDIVRVSVIIAGKKVHICAMGNPAQHSHIIYLFHVRSVDAYAGGDMASFFRSSKNRSNRTQSQLLSLSLRYKHTTNDNSEDVYTCTYGVQLPQASIDLLTPLVTGLTNGVVSYNQS